MRRANNVTIDADGVAALCHEYARFRNWHETPWEQFYYLSSEAVELAESLRGKGENAPLDEAADVLFVLFAILHRHGVSATQALVKLRDRVEVDARIRAGVVAEANDGGDRIEEERDYDLNHGWAGVDG